MTVPTIEGQDDPIELNFVIRSGFDWRVEFDWENSDGTDIDPSAMTMTCVWDSSDWGGVFPVELSSQGANPGITLEPGSIVFVMSAATTAALDFVTIKHQIHLTDDASKKRLWGYGRTRLDRGP